MQNIIKTNKTANFTIVDNSIINADLSALARMALIYLLSKPSSWKLRATDIKKHLGIGINKVYRLLQELRAAGYIVMRRIQSAVQWLVYDTPQGNIENAIGRAESHRDGFHHDGNGDDLVRTEKAVRTKNYNNPPTVPEQIPETAKPSVVVQDGLIDEKDPNQTQTTNADTRLGHGETIGGIVLSQNDYPSVARGIDGVVIDNIPGIDERHQQTAIKALKRLTPEQVQMVLAAFTLQCSKSNIGNRIGYLIGLTKAALDGSFTPVSGSGGAPLMTASERIAKEQARQEEAQARGRMTNEQHQQWLGRIYGKSAPKQSSGAGAKSIKAMLGWV